MHALLSQLLTASATPEPLAGVDAWWRRHLAETAEFDRPVQRAVAGGFAADRPAYAFASGYQEALRCLLGDLADAQPTRLALCATEAGGNHPRAIQSRLESDGDGYRLSGEKTYATLGTHADGYLVVASVGADERGRNRLAVVRVPAGRAGVTVEDAVPDARAIVPEIPHARLRFDAVRVEPDERVPGDGYDRWLKPFRTIEDAHVFAAVAAWLLQVGRRSEWPAEHLEALLLALVAVDGVATADPSQPTTHLALAGLIAHVDRVVQACEPHWDAVDEPTRTRWRRDRALLRVAGAARARRREVAWQLVGRSQA
ncbi:acyl-CoA dehydrogenase family protein [Haliangium sp.]|uniref:acyl-CoA dehydrogenase family protein n=1 Tax=Haliangium sp. TaxID=2663208 RepID=UPI003D11932E